MTGTFRCFDAKLRETLLASLQRTAEGVASALRCTARVRNEYLTPAVNNDPAVTQIAREAATEIVGKDRVTEWEPMTGSDDLAYFWQQIPGCYAFVGSGKTDGSPSPANHNARFDIDESALAIGADLFVRAARRVLQGVLS
jgi:metal-dependent amidase/aminoacylase/carboxypeptidase family protein